MKCLELKSKEPLLRRKKEEEKCGGGGNGIGMGCSDPLEKETQFCWIYKI